MTRWARSKSTHKHERQPQEATAWKDFLAQRQAQHQRNSTEDVSSHAGSTGSGNTETQAKKAPVHKSLSSEKLAGAKTAVVTSTETSGSNLKCIKKKRMLKKSPEGGLSSQMGTVCSEVPAVPKKGGTTLTKKRKAPLQREEMSSATADNSWTKVNAGTKVLPLDEKASGSTAKKRKKALSGKKQQGLPAAPKQNKSKPLPVQRRDKGTTAKTSGVHQEQLEDLTATMAGPTQSQLKNDEGMTGEKREASGVPRGAKAERLQRLRKEREAKGLLLLPEKVERKIYMLKKAMRKKGLPGDEIKEAVRKMRRKEELLFRRQLAKLCFKCRQPGHRVQDCPVILKDSDQAVGICFKCGSTEHFSSACTARTSSSNEFPFAKCFICQQQGHLSRKCPQNDKGVYPRGGHCNFCGAVDHFKRECPEMERNKKKAEEEEEVSAGMADLTQSADAENLEPLPAPTRTKQSKVVTF